MTDSVHDVLVATRDLIADPARWTQGAEARDASGYRVDARSGAAVCWCAVGALNRVCWELGANGELVINALGRFAGARAISDINDTQGHAAVLELFDAAIHPSEAE